MTKKQNRKTAKPATSAEDTRRIVVLVPPAEARRNGTRARKVYEAMAKLPNPRRTVAAARAAGYDAVDLRWDLERKHVRLK